MRHHELTTEEWVIVQPLLPNKPRGWRLGPTPRCGDIAMSDRSCASTSTVSLPGRSDHEDPCPGRCRGPTGARRDHTARRPGL